ncbi:MAG TPA: class I SAM-dependent methyltransferase [Stellaceae bacterium]|jgi:ubiquinone/menaquinone biosynthesis C-methylase UbiE
MAETLHGYVIDIPYLRDFKPMLAPAWLDHAVLVNGVSPPARACGFAWCDLGCGQGVSAVILATTHARGLFYGIDAMPAHIEHAQDLAAAAGVGNVRFEAADFAEAADRDYPPFDYIVSHGVYSWVDASTQAALRHFIDRHLKPGGLVYVSYDAMPGWARDLPFQYLLRTLAESFRGDSRARVSAATEVIRSLAAAPPLAASFVLGELAKQPDDYPPAYLVHEFMHAAWRPLYVTEMRAAMRAIGLSPVGSATFIENDDGLALPPAARALLAPIDDEDRRELVRDYFLDQRLRCDVFTRGSRRLDPGERLAQFAGRSFALARPAPTIGYAADTPAGRLAYDTPAARAILTALTAGPRRLGGIAHAHRHELLAAMLLLCAVGDVIPVEAAGGDVAALNRALWRRLDGPDPILWLALPCGTALPAAPGLLRRLRDGMRIDDPAFPGWRDFLTAHGLALGA